MQNLEDRATDRLIARHALHAGLALPVPSLDAILAIDDVESDRQRVDDLGGEAALLLDLHRALDDFALETPGIIGGAEGRREHIGDGEEEEALVGRERLLAAQDERAEHAMTGEEPNAAESASGIVAIVQKGGDVSEVYLVLTRTEPERALVSPELSADGYDNARRHGADRLTGGERRCDLRDGSETCGGTSRRAR